MTRPPELHRYAVYALLDDPSCQKVRQLQDQFSRWTHDTQVFRMPVHITVRGPFWGEPTQVKELYRRLLRHIESLTGLLKLKELRPKLVYQEPGMAWLRIETRSAASELLSDLHRTATSSLSRVVYWDEVPPEFQGSGFIPHITLARLLHRSVGFDLRAGAFQASLTSMNLAGLSLVEYPSSWPDDGHVRVDTLYNFTLQESRTLEASGERGSRGRAHRFDPIAAP